MVLNITIGLDPVNDITDPDVKVEAAAFINVLPSSYLNQVDQIHFNFCNLMVVKNTQNIIAKYLANGRQLKGIDNKTVRRCCPGLF